MDAQLSDIAYGGGKLSLNLDQIRNLAVPRVSNSDRGDRAAEISAAYAEFDGSQRRLSRSSDLLTEYKQSLITAAVTGELDVTTASTKVSA